jgi:hypothetical protein
MHSLTRDVREANLQRLYGITSSDFEKMVSAQAGKCAICLKEQQEEVLYVDHCHETGRVRGLLCRLCNFALSNLKDDPAAAARAARYLRQKTAPGLS